MLVLNKPGLIKDTLLTFNYCYEPYKAITPEEINQTVNTITERLQYYNCFNISYILRELIRVMENNNYNVIKHYNEFKPINLVKLLYLLGLDIKQYYTEVNLWNLNLDLTRNHDIKVNVYTTLTDTLTLLKKETISYLLRVTINSNLTRLSIGE